MPTQELCDSAYINGGIKTGQAEIIYKCNKDPVRFFRTNPFLVEFLLVSYYYLFTSPLPPKLRVIRLHFPLDKYDESWYIKIVIIL